MLCQTVFCSVMRLMPHRCMHLTLCWHLALHHFQTVISIIALLRRKLTTCWEPSSAHPAPPICPRIRCLPSRRVCETDTALLPSPACYITLASKLTADKRGLTKSFLSAVCDTYAQLGETQPWRVCTFLSGCLAGESKHTAGDGTFQWGETGNSTSFWWHTRSSVAALPTTQSITQIIRVNIQTNKYGQSSDLYDEWQIAKVWVTNSLTERLIQPSIWKCQCLKAA